ncbi:hypothetical protein H5410_061193 [Solanum commersonii]|uniref:DUF4283 domain-containing protein n=1 Tax=Solanum commersonii TaxID=4109 RepID=A0A9J5W710_SOLCO|nr:hypothetical protein H5410_061193 [Solanum commersonii]
MEFSSRFVSKIKIDEVILRWICSVMRLASKGVGDLYRRWGIRRGICLEFIRTSTLWEISSSRNIDGGPKKSAIIIPEMDYNVGWSDLADKIIDLWVSRLTQPPKFVTRNLSWMLQISEMAAMSSRPHSQLENLQEYLRCCLVGTFNDPFTESKSNNHPSLASGEDNNGEWFWNGRRLSLEWWSLESWIRAFGIPLHAWSEKSLKFIGDCCGGYIGADEDTKKRNHILWARICIPAVAQEPPHKIDLRKISVAGDSDEQGFNQQSKQVCVSKTEQFINSNLKSADAPRPIDSNLKSAEDPRVGPKNSKTTLGQLKAKAQLQQKTSDHLYYSRRKKGNLHLNKKKEILKEWKAIRPAQGQSIVAETQKLSERQSNAKLSQKPLLASLTQTDSLDELEGDADDEAECIRPLSLFSLPPIHSVFSIGCSQDSGFSFSTLKACC